MPFINGRFYLNPIFGAAIELARKRLGWKELPFSPPPPPEKPHEPEILPVAAQRSLQPQTQSQEQPAQSVSGHQAHPTPGLTLDPVREHIASVARAYGVPVPLAEAVVKKESNFDINAVNEKSKDYGLMQVHPSSIRYPLQDEHGFDFTVNKERVKNDWQYNTYAGMAILRDAYRFAQMHATGDDVPRVAYARYNAPGHWHEYDEPGTRVHKNVEEFMKIYNQYPH